jgi:hypothetical protein
MKGLYVMLDPFGGPDAKIGKTGHFEVRLGTYQNSYSSRSHIARFDYVWVGEGNAIDRLEAVLKKEFDWEIELDGRGHSEWLQDVDVINIVAKIEQVINNYKYKVRRVSKSYLPLTIHNLDKFFEKYDKKTLTE